MAELVIRQWYIYVEQNSERKGLSCALCNKGEIVHYSSTFAPRTCSFALLMGPLIETIKAAQAHTIHQGFKMATSMLKSMHSILLI